jgi:hypothetical protein
VVVRVDQDVGRLHVAVQDPPGVRRRQGIGDPLADVADPLLGLAPLRLQPLGQRPAGAEVHHQVWPPVGEDSRVVHRDDAGVAREPAGRPGLPQKTAPFLLLAQGPVIDLDRHLPVE